MADRYTEGLQSSQSPACDHASHPCIPLCCELEQHLPSLQGRLQWGLALWLKGTLLAHNGGQDSVATAPEPHGCFETVRRALREWTYDDTDRVRAWGPDREVDVEACFPELLGWVRALWTPDGDAPEAAAPLVLALDPTYHRDAWVVLVVSVVYREHAIPVAWHIVAAQARGSWVAHFGRLLLRQLAPAVPVGTPVHVLGSRELGGGPGTHWLGTGTAFGRDPMPGTLVVLHAQGHKEPWLLLTDTLPKHTDAALYACRLWARVWLTPTPGPNRAGDLRCLSLPVS